MDIKLIFSAFLLLVITFLCYSCNVTCDCDNSINKNILGNWERTVIKENGNTFEAILSIKETGKLHFILPNPVEGHTESIVDYSINDNILMIYNDEECNSVATYFFTVN